MTEDEETPPGGYRPESRATVLTYQINKHRGDTLDPLYLGELASQWSALLASGLPGDRIERLIYDGHGVLTVEFR